MLNIKTQRKLGALQKSYTFITLCEKNDINFQNRTVIGDQRLRLMVPEMDI